MTTRSVTRHPPNGIRRPPSMALCYEVAGLSPGLRSRYFENRDAAVRYAVRQALERDETFEVYEVAGGVSSPIPFLIAQPEALRLAIALAPRCEECRALDALGRLMTPGDRH